MKEDLLRTVDKIVMGLTGSYLVVLGFFENIEAACRS